MIIVSLLRDPTKIIQTGNYFGKDHLYDPTYTSGYINAILCLYLAISVIKF